MRRLDLPFTFDLLQIQIPLRIGGAGNVSVIEHQGFTISLTQNISHDVPEGTLTVHAVTFQIAEMPHLNQNVYYSGELITVEMGEPIFLVNENFHNMQ